MRARGIALGIAGVAVATAGCSGTTQAHYKVTLGSEARRVAHVYGCPACHPFVTLDDGAAMTWNETRSVPRTYSVEVNGRRSRCPQLRPASDAEHSVVSVAYVVNAKGRCTADQAQ